jgi:hypothetical protein
MPAEAAAVNAAGVANRAATALRAEDSMSAAPAASTDGASEDAVGGITSTSAVWLGGWATFVFFFGAAVKLSLYWSIEGTRGGIRGRAGTYGLNDAARFRAGKEVLGYWTLQRKDTVGVQGYTG